MGIYTQEELKRFVAAARLCGEREVRLDLDGYLVVYTWDDARVRYRFEPGDAAARAPGEVIAQLTPVQRQLMFLLPEFEWHPTVALKEGQHYRLTLDCLPLVELGLASHDVSQIDGRVLVQQHKMYANATCIEFFNGRSLELTWATLWSALRAGRITEAQ